jgi:hypothetical protein
MINTSPQNNHPVFFGVTSRLFNRDEESESCLQDAAIQAAQFFSVYGTLTFLKEKSGAGVGYLQDIDVGYDEALAGRLKEQLNVLEEIQDEDGTYILAELDSTNLNLPRTPGISSLPPKWIKTTPTIEGYHVGVGITQRKRLFKDSIEEADRRALAELISMISLEIKSLQTEQSVDTMGTAHETTSLEQAKAMIKGFYIMSRWRSMDENYFYSLAVCPKNQ